MSTQELIEEKVNELYKLLEETEKTLKLNEKYVPRLDPKVVKNYPNVRELYGWLNNAKNNITRVNEYVKSVSKLEEENIDDSILLYAITDDTQWKKYEQRKAWAEYIKEMKKGKKK